MRQGEDIHYKAWFWDETVGALNAVDATGYVRMQLMSAELDWRHKAISACPVPLVGESADRALACVVQAFLAATGETLLLNFDQAILLLP